MIARFDALVETTTTLDVLTELSTRKSGRLQLRWNWPTGLPWGQRVRKAGVLKSRISLIIDIIHRQAPGASFLEQAGDMARASSGGAVLTDFKSAMVLTLLSDGLAIGEIGELQTAFGLLPLWTIV